MTGETDLTKLLRTMCPVLAATPYSFGLLPEGASLPGAFALIREDEGTTVIAPLEVLRAAGIAHQGPWARISLTVHSALTAVGLTAAVATALTREGISANVVAGYHHDHFFVQAGRAQDAMAVFARLSA
tara:strand:+ start:167 stop:553 length:387 start_codon:yes stop_codon:yes gene_type:complete